MGIEKFGAHGTTAAIALLTDAIKKGGVMGCKRVGGLSGTFTSVSEDGGMNKRVKDGILTIEKLEALTAVCSVGIDMIAIPGDVDKSIISGIIADVMAIGVVNNKTTSVRLIPVPGKKPGETVDFGGLLGKGTIMKINKTKSSKFFERGGFIERPITSMKN